MAEENIRLGDRLEALDREILAWAKLTRDKIQRKLLELGVEDKLKLAKTVRRIRIKKNREGQAYVDKEDYLYRSLRYRLLRKNLEIEGIAFSMARHGIFFDRGVGRGRKVNSSSAEKHKSPWIAPILEPSIEDLANILAEEYADIISAELKITVPGIINTKITKS